jgi:hypothetical protein
MRHGRRGDQVVIFHRRCALVNALWLLWSPADAQKKPQIGFQFGGEEMQNVLTIAPAADTPARNAVSLSAEGTVEAPDHAWP